MATVASEQPLDRMPIHMDHPSSAGQGSHGDVAETALKILKISLHMNKLCGKLVP